MNPQESNAPGSSSKTILGILTFILGVVLVLIFPITPLRDPFRDYGVRFGFVLIAFGTGIIIWRLYALISNSDVISLMLFMRRETLIAIFKDKERGKAIITERILEWAHSPETSSVKIKGVTLNLVFGNNGILKDCLDGNKIINPERKAIQALLLNPYSTSAITRSIQESRPFILASNPMETICEHTLDRHKQYVLYDDFKRTVGNITDLMKHSDKYRITIECRIYSTTSPSFLLIDGQRAISENLILGRKKNDPEGKLYGILPHLIYGNGEIKDSLESHFDYIWSYDSIPLEDFHERVEEKNYEINRLFLLYNLQKEIWERQWNAQAPGRSFSSVYDMLYRGYKEFYPNFSPKRILDLGCGDGGGGSLTILKEHPNAKFDHIDIAQNAIDIFEKNIKNERLENSNVTLEACDMLTFLNRCEPLQYSLVYANFSIIYMTKIKAVEIYRMIFNVMHSGGVFMLSLWTTDYFKMPISKHGEEGSRPPHVFTRVPMTEDLQVLTGGCKLREGEIRRFYRGFEELLEEFHSADENRGMDFEGIQYRYYEKGAILRVWIGKK